MLQQDRGMDNLYLLDHGNLTIFMLIERSDESSYDTVYTILYGMQTNVQWQVLLGTEEVKWGEGWEKDYKETWGDFWCWWIHKYIHIQNLFKLFTLNDAVSFYENYP